MNRPFDIALAQMTPADGDIDANLAKMETIIHECKRKFPNVRLLLFPELCTTGYVLSEMLKEAAQTWDGSTFQHMSQLAQTFQLYLAYGYVEKDHTGNLYNSLILINPNGQCIGNYRKIHLTPFEKAWVFFGSRAGAGGYRPWPHRSDDLLGLSFSGTSKIPSLPWSRASSRSMCLGISISCTVSKISHGTSDR